MTNQIVALVFKYSVNYEIRRILYSLKKINWYKENKYYVALPMELGLFGNKVTQNSLREMVKKEFKNDHYRRISLQLSRSWKTTGQKVIPNLIEDGFKLKKYYYIYLTKYGVGGSYHLPNKIILNFQRRKNKYLIKTIIHEIIHLSIEKLTQKYKISHWQKERLVDLIVLKVYPKWKEVQKISQPDKKVDNTFRKYYPDVNKIIARLA